MTRTKIAKAMAITFTALFVSSAANALNHNAEEEICAAAIAAEIDRSADDTNTKLKKIRPRKVTRATVQVKFSDGETVTGECYIRSGAVESVEIQDRKPAA